MGYEVSRADARKLLEDKKLMDEVVREALANPEVLEELAESVADEISEVIEDDPTFTQKMIEAVKGDPGFRKQLVKALIDELGD
ncbi:MAG: hypothetical protein RX316_10195 [bacterium]|nr:hypothetical protein [bacterium]